MSAVRLGGFDLLDVEAFQATLVVATDIQACDACQICDTGDDGCWDCIDNGDGDD